MRSPSQVDAHEAASSLASQERAVLRRVARESVEHGLRHRVPLAVDPAGHSEALRVLRATFVTLRIEGALRGCTGTLEATRPLVQDVAQNAFAAAFRDPRFAPLRQEELAGIEFHLSLLSRPVPLAVGDERELLEQLRPGVDGLILREGSLRVTFLPAVWQSLASPEAFLRELRRKAGLAPDYWSDELRFARYVVESID